jgi:nesprin-1
MATIDNLKPHQIKPQQLNAMSNRDRLDMAFKFADSELGIPSLLDPIDVDVENPDERSIMTYVGQFLHKYPTRKQPPMLSYDEKLKQIQQWLAEQNSEYDAMNGRYPTITQLELYTCAVTMYDEKLELFRAQKVMPENIDLVRSIEHAFGDMESHLRNWFLQLVMVNLPEEFSGINQWLYQAEILAKDMFIPAVMNEETASIISKKLEEHKKFFAAQINVEQSFSSLRIGHDWNAYQRALIDILANRLANVGDKAKQRRIYLKFLEHKCCLIAFLNLVESKINQVRSKTYEETLDSFRNMENFVSKNRIVQEFERALEDMKQVIQEYKVDGSDGGLSQPEAAKVDKFLYDTECRWKSVHSKLICTQSMLAEALAYWEKWQMDSNEFLLYLNEAEKNLSDPKNIAFFSDIKNWVKRFDQLTECYQFLTTINGSSCSDHKQEIDHVYHNISTRWNSINSSGRKLICSQYVSANREKYDAGVKNLIKWINNAEQTLNGQPSNYNIEDIQTYGHAVMQIQKEIDDIEELFKNISTTLQELIPDLSRESVDQMMRQLKTEKEALVKVRAMVPIKLHLYHQLLAQKENLEKGLAEIEKWLDQSEKLLGSYGKTSDRDTILHQLEQHKQFFSRIVYYKSMLESKNKLSNHLNSSLGASIQSKEDTAMQRMQQINDRFNYVVANAVEWEQKLKDMAKSWKSFVDCERILINWQRHAEHYFQNIPTASSANDLEVQKQFFDSFDERWMRDFETFAGDLINLTAISAQQINCTDRTDIVQRVENIRQLDSATKQKIPIHMLQLEYTKNQEVMSKSLKMLEKIITGEEQNYSSGSDVNQVQQRVSQLKNSDSSMFCQTEYLLSILENIAKNYMKLNGQPQQPQDKLLTTHNNLCMQWENICKRLTILENNISQTKNKWEQYHQNFANVSSWMDRVDKALEGILKEVSNEEEFENEKATFQVSTVI